MAYLKSNDLFGKLNPETLFEQVPRPILIADHLMTPDNMGALIRLADNIGASEVCFMGKEEEHRLGKVRRAAASSRDNIRWYFSEESDLRKIVPEGKKIVHLSSLPISATPDMRSSISRASRHSRRRCIRILATP